MRVLAPYPLTTVLLLYHKSKKVIIDTLGVSGYKDIYKQPDEENMGIKFFTGILIALCYLTSLHAAKTAYVAGQNIDNKANFWTSPLSPFSLSESTIRLDSTATSYAIGVAFSANKAFFVGQNDTGYATLWIRLLGNNQVGPAAVPLEFGVGNQGGYGASATVSGGILYIVGQAANGTPHYWKCGLDGSISSQDTIANETSGYASDIAISTDGTTMYVVGQDSAEQPTLWSSPTSSISWTTVSLPATTDVNPLGSASGIVYGTGTTVYVVGTVTSSTTPSNEGAAFWKVVGGTPTYTSIANNDLASALGIALNGTTAYIVGSDNAGNAAFWSATSVNTTPVFALPISLLDTVGANLPGYGSAVTYNNTDIYVVGRSNSNAGYSWVSSDSGVSFGNGTQFIQ